MKFEVIPDQQTPLIEELVDVNSLLEKKELCDAFLNYATTRLDAVGLAANQTSIDGERLMERMFAIRNLDKSSLRLNLKDDSWQLIINPKILRKFGMVDNKVEGCITWVGRKMVAKRSRFIEVSYHKQDGTFVESEILRGLAAQIWQHETDHLNGIEEEIVDRNFAVPKEKEPGRNDDCPCNSGKKYKKCCMLQ